MESPRTASQSLKPSDPRYRGPDRRKSDSTGEDGYAERICHAKIQMKPLRNSKRTIIHIGRHERQRTHPVNSTVYRSTKSYGHIFRISAFDESVSTALNRVGALSTASTCHLQCRQAHTCTKPRPTDRNVAVHLTIARKSRAAGMNKTSEPPAGTHDSTCVPASEISAFLQALDSTRTSNAQAVKPTSKAAGDIACMRFPKWKIPSPYFSTAAQLTPTGS